MLKTTVPSIIIHGTLDHYLQDCSQWTARFFTLLSDGSLHIYKSKLETNQILDIILINYCVSISKSESTEDGQLRQTIRIGTTQLMHGMRYGTTVLIGTRSKSVQEAWFEMLLRFSDNSQIGSSPSSIKLVSLDVQFEGPLEKRGYWNPAFKSRYFVLSKKGTLSYFAAESDKCSPDPLGSIPVRNAIINCIPSAPGRPQFTILVQSPASPVHGRTFILAAPTDDDLTRWVRELGRAARPEGDATRPAPPAATAGGGGGGGAPKDG
jgi:hypothetical protein